MSLITFYLKNKETGLSGKWIHYKQIAALLSLYSEFPFAQNKLGLSHRGTPIQSIQIGTGKIKNLAVVTDARR